MDFLKYIITELWGGFNLRGRVSPNFQRPLGSSGETMHRIPKNFRDARTCLRSSITVAKTGEARISPAARAAKDVELLVCLSVSVTLLNDGVSAYDFAMKLLEYRNGFDTIG